MSEVAIILILIIISFCCGIISSLISSGVVFMGDFDFDFGSLGLVEDGDPSAYCKIRFNQGSCADKGDQSSVLTATSGNPVDVNLDEGGLNKWGDQDGDSMDIKGNCSNIKIFDVNGEPLEISTYYSQNWKCTDFSSDMQGDVERVQFQMGAEMSADEFSAMTNIKPCEVKINNGTCSNKGTQSVVMSAMPEDGMVQYDLDNNGLSGWSDQNGESIEIKGNCKDITVNDRQGPPSGDRYHPFFKASHISENWECTDFSEDLQDDLAIVSFQNGTEPPPPPPPPPGTSPPPPPPPRANCSTLTHRPHRAYSCDHISSRCDTTIDDWGYLCYWAGDAERSLYREGHPPNMSKCSFMKDSVRGGMAVCANHTPVHGGGR